MQLDSVINTAKIYRQRLYDISWFMRLLNEHIARRANKEDNCTGRFWEGRFKPQALLDEAALAACMAYVDLNPVRANMEKTPESSRYTSIKKRNVLAKLARQPAALYPFAGNPQKNSPRGMPFCLIDYLQLVDLTARHYKTCKRGNIPKVCSPTLQRTGVGPALWHSMVNGIENRFFSSISVRIADRKFNNNFRLNTA